jgi:hypothetical protein
MVTDGITTSKGCESRSYEKRHLDSLRMGSIFYQYKLFEMLPSNRSELFHFVPLVDPGRFSIASVHNIVSLVH